MNYFTRAFRTAFTIIELLIVVAIILFLAKIVVPRYSHYYARARQAEVAINLSSLYTAQQTYHVEYGRYTSNLKAIGWQPKGYTGNPATTQNYYTYGSSGGQEGIHFFTGTSGAPAHLLGSEEVSGDKMIFKAATITNGTAEVWRIDEMGDLRKVTK